MDPQTSPLNAEERLQRQGQLSPSTTVDLIVIGASAGGHQALIQILKDLPAETPAPIVLLLHQAPDSIGHLKGWLERYSRLPIVEVKGETPLRPGTIFVPPPGVSAGFSGGMITATPYVRSVPTSTINSLFISAARNYGDRVIGVVLTGMLRDGTVGLRAIHEAGGLTIVQNPREAEFPDMPANAMEQLPVTFCLDLAEIGPALELLVRRAARFETGLEVAIRTLQDRTALLVRLVAQSWRNPGTRRFLEEELALLKSALHSIDDLVKQASIAAPPST